MASGRQVEYSLRLNSNASSVLNADAAAANKFDNSMSQVSNTLTRFGIVLGAHAMIEASKEWTQAAADYEVAMLRIKNASIEGMGAFNQQFINSEVDHFKLKLQESADAYGNFLFKIKNANLSNDVQNRLFENLNVVGKVGGIPQEQMDATVRNVGILLGEGVLEARHLRQLSYVHPQIVPFLADALGIKSGQKDEFSALFKTNIDDETAQQKFSQLISSGKLTKLGLNANVILEAFEKYRVSIESKLPETLDTVQSHLNSLSATWERFKNSLVLGQKPELLEFFQSLESSIHWLAEHEEGIISTGKAILHLVEAYAAWRVAIMALHVPSAILGFLVNEHNRLNGALGIGKERIAEQVIANQVLVESEEKEIVATEQIATAIIEKTTALDLFTEAQIRNYGASELLSETFLINQEQERIKLLYLEEEQRLLSANTLQADLFTKSQMDLAIGTDSLTAATFKYNEELALNNKLLVEQDELLATGGISGGATAITATKGAGLSGVGLLSSGLVYVGIAWMANDILNAMFPKHNEYWDSKDIGQHFGIEGASGDYANNYLNMMMAGYVNKFHPDLRDPSKLNIDDIVPYLDAVWVSRGQYEALKNPSPYSTSGQNPYYVDEDGTNPSILAKYGIKSKVNTAKVPEIPKHQLRGNSSNYFTVHIDTMNGINKLEVKEASESQIQNLKQTVGIEVDRMMQEVINDIQVVRTGH